MIKFVDFNSLEYLIKLIRMEVEEKIQELEKRIKEQEDTIKELKKFIKIDSLGNIIKK